MKNQSKFRKTAEWILMELGKLGSRATAAAEAGSHYREDDAEQGTNDKADDKTHQVTGEL